MLDAILPSPGGSSGWISASARPDRLRHLGMENKEFTGFPMAGFEGIARAGL
jgi:hypothetical protein